jgi:hypothetical protein
VHRSGAKRAPRERRRTKAKPKLSVIVVVVRPPQRQMGIQSGQRSIQLWSPSSIQYTARPQPIRIRNQNPNRTLHTKTTD